MSRPFTPRQPRAAAVASVEDVLALVRARGGRATPSRRILLEVLFDSDEHLSAEELAESVQSRAPDVHISTIYRNLEDLQRLGVVAHTHLGHGPATYQLASLAHAHFICEDCGAMVEAPDELFRGLARAAKAKLGFSIDPHHFAILGRCAACDADAGDRPGGSARPAPAERVRSAGTRRRTHHRSAEGGTSGQRGAAVRTP